MNILFDLFPARAAIYGVKTMDEFLAYGPHLSLKTEGYSGQTSRLLCSLPMA